MASDSNYITYVLELLESIGPVTSRRMFGGYGIFLDGLMFAIVADDTLYFKVDDTNRGDFEAKGLEPFYYVKKGKQMSMSYYLCPEEALENPEEMRCWAEKSYAVAVKAAAAKQKKK